MEEMEKKDTIGWRSINLTNQRWNKICKELLPELNFMRAFTSALNHRFSCSGELPSDYELQLRFDNGKLIFPSPPDLDQTKVVFFLLYILFMY